MFCGAAPLTKWTEVIYSVHVIQNIAHQPSMQASYTAGRVRPNKETVSAQIAARLTISFSVDFQMFNI